MNEQELLAAHGELIRQVRPFMPPPEDDRLIRGEVASWVLPRLKDLAARLGYPVRYRSAIEMMRHGDLALGATVTLTPRAGLVPFELALLNGMTPAAQARTLAHELNHALQSATAARVRGRVAVGDIEEVIAESGGALICRALRVPGEGNSISWLGQHHGELLIAARGQAVLRAGKILGALR